MSRTNIDTLEERVAALPRSLREHVRRVRETAQTLAGRFNADSSRVDAAVLVHDLARADAPSRLLSFAREHEWKLDPVEVAFPMFLHGAVAAAQAKDLGIDDAGILGAAAYHTTGRAGMSDIEMIVFLADKLEPGKGRRFRGLARARQRAEHDLTEAVLEALTWHVRYYAGRDDLLHPQTIEARNELLLTIAKAKRPHQL